MDANPFNPLPLPIENPSNGVIDGISNESRCSHMKISDYRFMHQAILSSLTCIKIV